MFFSKRCNRFLFTAFSVGALFGLFYVVQRSYVSTPRSIDNFEKFIKQVHLPIISTANSHLKPPLPAKVQTSLRSASSLSPAAVNSLRIVAIKKAPPASQKQVSPKQKQNSKPAPFQQPQLVQNSQQPSQQKQQKSEATPIIQPRRLYKNTKCGCITFDEIQKLPKFARGITQVVHYHYKSHKLPREFFTFARKCMKVNTNLTYVLWTPEGLNQFIAPPYFPKDRADVFRSYHDRMEGSDVARNHFLYKLGGVYMDLDTECNRPFYEVMNRFECVLDQEHPAQGLLLHKMNLSVMTSLMACRAQHPFFYKHVWSQQMNPGFGHILSKTGPHRLTKAYLEFKKQHGDKISLDVADARVFSPLMDPPMFNSWLPRCAQPQTEDHVKRGCTHLLKLAKTKEQDVKNAIAIHRFLHLGYSWAESRITQYLDICEAENQHINIAHKTCQF